MVSGSTGRPLSGKAEREASGRRDRSSNLCRANDLMVEALRLLDEERSNAAPYLDYAIVRLGIRPIDEGFPPYNSAASDPIDPPVP